MCPQVLSGDHERTPNPPLGYSCDCHLNRDKQIHIVALFHAHKIRPSRIAYRVGIDIAFIEALIEGEEEVSLFSHLLAGYRKNRYKQQLNQAERLTGSARFERRQVVENEYADDHLSKELFNSLV